jgi:hypothetical protein
MEKVIPQCALTIERPMRVKDEQFDAQEPQFLVYALQVSHHLPTQPQDDGRALDAVPVRRVQTISARVVGIVTNPMICQPN